MKHLCIYTNTNTLIGTLGGSATPRFKRDGDEFTREAKAYQKHHISQGSEVWTHGISARQPFKDRLWDFSRVIGQHVRDHGNADVLAYWGHGYQRGIQLGFKWRHGAQLLANDMIGLNAKTLILYACSCAKGKNNFMLWIAQELIKKGFYDFKLIGHDRKGHTMRNPFVVVYQPIKDKITGVYMGDQFPGTGGIHRIEFRSLMEGTAWKQWRESLHGSMRFEFPFAGIEEEKKWF